MPPDEPRRRPARALRRTLDWAAAAVAAAFLAAALASPSFTPLARGLIFLGIALSLWSPAMGLLGVALAAPFGHLAASFLAAPAALADAWAAAFLVGWAAHGRNDAAGPRMPRLAGAAGWSLAVLAVLQLLPSARAQGPVAAWTVAARGFFVGGDRPVLDALAMLEGCVLACAAVDLLRTRPALAVRLPAWLTAGLVLSTGTALAVRDARGAAAAGPAIAMMLAADAGCAVRARMAGASIARTLAWIVGLAALAASLYALPPGALFGDRPPLPRWPQGVAIVAAAAGLVLLMGLFWQMVRGVRASPRDVRLIAFLAGALAFLGLSLSAGTLTGGDQAIPFWMLSGLGAGLADSSLLAGEAEAIRPSAS